SAITNYATLTVTKLSQNVITFIGPGDQQLASGSVGISATDSASLQVTFTSTTPTCSVSGGTLNGSTTTATVTFNSLGLCSITASSHDVNNIYNDATPVTQSFNIVSTALTCTLGNLTVNYNGNPQSPTCGTHCSVSITPQTAAGAYPVSAVPDYGYSCSSTIPAPPNYFTINKVNANITVTPYNVNHDGNSHSASCSATGVTGAPLSGLDCSGTAHTDTGDYPSDPWT